MGILVAKDRKLKFVVLSISPVTVVKLKQLFNFTFTVSYWVLLYHMRNNFM